MARLVPSSAAVNEALEASRATLGADYNLVQSFLNTNETQETLRLYNVVTASAAPINNNSVELSKEVEAILSGLKDKNAAAALAILRSPSMQASLRTHDAIANDSFEASASAASPAPVAASAATVAPTAAATTTNGVANNAVPATTATATAAAATAVTAAPTSNNNEVKPAADKVEPAGVPARAPSASSSQEIVERSVTKVNGILGATITERDGKIYIARVIAGGPAFKSKALSPDDQVLAIDNIDVTRKKCTEVIEIMKKTGEVITFKLKLSPNSIAAGGASTPSNTKQRYLQANFSYDPSTDEFCPCREAGLLFHRRDVLKVLNDDDSDWWQAQRVGTNSVGLIPSIRMQERRPAAKAAAQSAQQQKLAQEDQKKRKSFIKRLTMRRKSLHAATAAVEVDTKTPASDEPYVEVSLEQPSKEQKRPLVLVGASAASGRSELKQSLIADFPDRFGVTVPHTTRPAREGEVSGRDYIFVSRPEMETMIKDGKFVEYGEFQGNLYGTSIETIKAVVDSGRVCLIDVHPHTLKNLRRYKPAPLVVFIRPPAADKIQAQGGQAMTPQEIEHVVEASAKIDYNYGHYFDEVLVNESQPATYEKLKTLLDKAETEEYWAPVVNA